MNVKEKAEHVIREFKLTTMALKNKTTIYLLTVVVLLFGIYSYRSMPKELFPDIAFPYILVQTMYPGNPPVDIENLITRPLEKEIDGIKGIKTMSSTSMQGVSSIFIEFNPDVEIKQALQEVKDETDKAKSDLPDDINTYGGVLVTDIDATEWPIININLSGDYSADELREYGEVLEEQIERISEVSKVEIRGINDKEIKINADPHQMNARKVSFFDIQSAVQSENFSMSGGEIKLGKSRRSVRTIGEFTTVDEIKNIVVKDENGDIVYLKDVADVEEGYEEATSYASLGGEPVITLQVVKKGGENLLEAIRKIEEILSDVKKEHVLPDNLNTTITDDQSRMVKMQLHNLENSMILSIIFVITVLFFFLGTRDSLFVGLAIPLSMFISFVVLELIDFRVNMIVLFALILALGMLVDNAIVVVENIHRFIANGYTRFQAAKRAVGEIAIPIIASTATTLAVFIPLAFWNGIIGEFMKYLPITLIIVLTSSLFVALVIIPVFAASFAKKGEQNSKPNKKRALYLIMVLAALAVMFYLTKVYVLANLLSAAILITALNITILNRLGKWFQNVFLVKLENFYEKVLRVSLRKRNPGYFLTITFLLLIGTSMFYFGFRSPKVEFFPTNDPKTIKIQATLPSGTDIERTKNFMDSLQMDVKKIIGDRDTIVESYLTNVGKGAGSGRQNDIGNTGVNKGLISVTFYDFELRHGIRTSDILHDLAVGLIDRYPGVDIEFEQNKMGPPAGMPINIEISGDDYEKLIALTDSIQFIIDQSDIKGIEGLRMDLDIGKPEVIVSIDRDRAGRFGLSTRDVAMALRTAIFGSDISDYKIGEDEYPIQLRLKSKYRNNMAVLMNQNITFRNTHGKVVQVPISSVADFRYSSTYNAVKRKDMNRLITLSSNVIQGYNANEIMQQIGKLLKDFRMPEGYEYKFTGEQQDMAESMSFLMKALLIGMSLIILILVSQFNSVVKPFIIMASVLFSTIGVFGGLGTFNMNFIVVMTGVGIVALAGVVVNNAIVLIDYIDLLKNRKREELGMEERAFLPVNIATECVIQAGKTRLRPVLLTAITTILGLLPMAIGANIDFENLLTNFDPNFFIGGDMTMIWGPISWTIIFGLSFATFLTLIIVPVMYRIATRAKYGILKLTGKIS